MPKERYTLEIILATLLLVLGGFVGVCLFFGHPAEYAWLPPCPFRVWTGLLCPGCGTLRATHYFLNGQFDLAFRCQPLLISLLPILVVLTSKSVYENVRKTNVTLPFELQLYWLMVIVISLFFMLRNIPLDCFEYLRPPG